MSTRCTIHFHWGHDKEVEAIVYRHSDGYPEGILPDLQQFFADVVKQTNDTRFNDPSYLAAKYVVWQANQYARRYDFETGEYVKGAMLNFLSVGVLMQDPGDIEYRYHIHCGELDTNGYPEVTHESVSWGESL